MEQRASGFAFVPPNDAPQRSNPRFVTCEECDDRPSAGLDFEIDAGHHLSIMVPHGKTCGRLFDGPGGGMRCASGRCRGRSTLTRQHTLCEVQEPLDVRPHPHIGLSTVTYLFDGEIMHRDSLGTVLAIRPGELNWMTAGTGSVNAKVEPWPGCDSNQA
jgi:Pirin